MALGSAPAALGLEGLAKDTVDTVSVASAVGNWDN